MAHVAAAQVPTSSGRLVDGHEVLEEPAPHARALTGRHDVGVADQVDVADGLEADDADQGPVALEAGEDDARGGLAVELGRRHVRVVPPVGGDHAAVGLRGGVDDREDRVPLVVPARPHLAHRSSLGRPQLRQTP